MAPDVTDAHSAVPQVARATAAAGSESHSPRLQVGQQQQ